MRKNSIRFVFLFLGLVFLFVSASSTITGNVIMQNSLVDFSLFKIIGIIFLFVSMIIFVSRQTLDVIVIPTGAGEFNAEEEMYSQDRDRAEKAVRRRNRLSEEGYFVISGRKHEDKKIKRGQSVSIHNYLTRHGIKPENIITEGKSYDSLENVLYTLKKVKEKEGKKHGRTTKPIRIAFVSYSEHLKRFEDFEKEAIRKGLIEKGDFEFYNIKTFPRWDERKEQRAKEKDYEKSPIRKFAHKFKLEDMRRYHGKSERIKYVKPSPIIEFAKKIRDYFSR
tara:strand:+ start:2031 stop:2867 length:837 start_codon:yes stop_codon:yes gene_type:complete